MFAHTINRNVMTPEVWERTKEWLCALPPYFVCSYCQCAWFHEKLIGKQKLSHVMSDRRRTKRKSCGGGRVSSINLIFFIFIRFREMKQGRARAYLLCIHYFHDPFLSLSVMSFSLGLPWTKAVQKYDASCICDKNEIGLPWKFPECVKAFFVELFSFSFLQGYRHNSAILLSQI